jgi:sulfur relay (sulfurtransferase) complex TusBCD TusD component (DsrE family)
MRRVARAIKFARVRFRHLPAGKRGEAPQTIQARNFGKPLIILAMKDLEVTVCKAFALARARGAEIPV